MNFPLTITSMSWILGIWTVLKVTHSTLRQAYTQTTNMERVEKSDLMEWKKYPTARIKRSLLKVFNAFKLQRNRKFKKKLNCSLLIPPWK